MSGGGRVSVLLFKIEVTLTLNESPLGSGSGPDAEVERLYGETRPAVCAYLLYLGVPESQTQEVAQEVYLRLYQTLIKGTAIENPRAWVFRVAHNLGLKVRGYERLFHSLTGSWERLTDLSRSPETLLIDQERNSRVTGRMKDLSSQQRICLYLRSQGLLHREIAEVLGIKPSTVNEFLRRAMERLAEAANG